MQIRTAFLLTLAALTTACGATPAPLGVAPTRAEAVAARQAGTPDLAVRQAVGTPAQPAAQAVTFDLLTYNTWGKPGLLGTDLKRRFSRLGGELGPYGVVAMQETFSTYARRMAKDTGFPHQHYQNNWDLLNLNSGLMTLSQYPIVKTDFKKFKQAAHADQFANKGVLLTRLDIPGIGEVDIYNTHYQAQSKYSEIRIHDNQTLEALIKRNDKGNPTFLLGDFNMAPGTPEYQDLMKRLSPRDSWAELYPDQPGYTASPDNPRRKKGSSAKRIDYIFVLPNARYDIRVERLQVAFTEPVQGVVLSDHYGLAGRFSVTPKAP